MLPDLARCWILLLFPCLTQPSIFFTVFYIVLFDQEAVSTTHVIVSHRARRLRLPRSHITPILSPHLAVSTIRPWRETSCAGGESTRHRLPQRSLWADDGKIDKVSVASTPSQIN